MSRWSRYWFAEGGRLAAAVVRIAIAAAVLLTLAHIRHFATLDYPAGIYRPVGVWMLLGRTPPPSWLVDALWLIAWGATGAMLVGLASRAATAASLGAAVALASLSFAGSHTWSHQYNVVFLAQLAFLGARGGDALSLDAVLRRARKLPALDVARGYQWSLRLVQLAVALMFAGAAFHKILHGHFTLRWALSDNLRHQLLVRFDLAGLPRPPLVDWLIDDVWRYRTAAVLNLVSQAAPLAACFLMRRPVWRAVFGAFFLVETIALDQVVALWNPHWLPLYAVFVDWDALIARVRRTPVVAARDEAPRPSRAVRIFVIAFVVYDAITALVPAVDQRLNTFPFSGFPMFATIRVRAPYDEHLAFSVEGDRFEVIADRPVDAEMQLWFDHHHRGMAALRDRGELERRLRALLDDARARYPDAGIRGVRLYLTIFETPAYPAPAHFEAHPIAIVGAIEPGGGFRSELGNLALAGARYVAYVGDVPTPVEWHDGMAGDPLVVVAIAPDGLAWLVATHTEWHWQ